MQIRQVVQCTQFAVFGSLILHIVPMLASAGRWMVELGSVFASHHGVDVMVENVEILRSEIRNRAADSVMQAIHTILCQERIPLRPSGALGVLVILAFVAAEATARPLNARLGASCAMLRTMGKLITLACIIAHVETHLV